MIHDLRVIDSTLLKNTVLVAKVEARRPDHWILQQCIQEMTGLDPCDISGGKGKIL